MNEKRASETPRPAVSFQSAFVCVNQRLNPHAAILSEAEANPPPPSTPNCTVTASLASPVRVPRKPCTMYCAPWLAAEAGTVASVKNGRRFSLVEPLAPPIPMKAVWPGSLREMAKNAPLLAEDSVDVHETVTLPSLFRTTAKSVGLPGAGRGVGLAGAGICAAA